MERLVKVDPGNRGWQRDLSVSYTKIGDVLVLVISPGDHAAIGLVGDNSLAANVISGEFDAAVAQQTQNLAALLHSLPKTNLVESADSSGSDHNRSPR